MVQPRPDPADFISPREESTKTGSKLTDDQRELFTLSIIIPTKNEANNIVPLLTRIERATHGIPCEVIFVDDSADGTPAVIESTRRRFSFPITTIVRPEDRQGDGLSGAIMEGLRASSSEWVCVMDGDLQHPPEVIPRMFQQAKNRDEEIVVGSRFAPNGELKRMGRLRSAISWGLAILVRILFIQQLRRVSDPLSGFFLIRRTRINPEQLNPIGFKILLEILIRYPELEVGEVPIQMGKRYAGRSKAQIEEGIRFLKHLLRLQATAYRRLARFLAVGATGLLVNNLALAGLTELAGVHYLVSAVAATQFSTVWNFALTEIWVFGDRNSRPPRPQRLGRFLLMNNSMLLFRGPLLALLVSGLGTHYVLANLFTLVVLSLIRYLVSDQWIWTQDRSPKSQEPYRYDVHGIVKIESTVQLPELEYFRTSHVLNQADIRLQIEPIDRTPPSNGAIHYDEGLGRLGFGIQITHGAQTDISASPLLRWSPHVLYTNVIEPILRWTLVRKGYALIHGACLAVDGNAMLITARTDTGKTTTILKALSNHPWTFLSDDMTIVSPDGQVLSFPKPLTISLHTLQAVDNAELSFRERLALQVQSRLHSRMGRRLGLLLSELGLPAATLNACIQLLIPPPKYLAHRLVPHVRYLRHAQVTQVVIIERGPDSEETLEQDTLVAELIKNAEDAYGFPPYPKLAGRLSQWKGLDLHPVEEAIIREAFEGRSAVRISSSNYRWWQRLPSFISVSIPQFEPADPVGRARPTRPRQFGKVK